jgi:hypothetical protein
VVHESIPSVVLIFSLACFKAMISGGTAKPLLGYSNYAGEEAHILVYYQPDICPVRNFGRMEQSISALLVRQAQNRER